MKSLLTREECHDLAGTLVRHAAEINKISERIKHEKVDGVNVDLSTLVSLINNKLEARILILKNQANEAFLDMKLGNDVTKKKDRERKKKG